MKFGSVPLAQALGATLAHSVALSDGRLRKGRILSDADLEQLAQAGLSEITVAQLEPGDIAEDDAATRLGQALVPDPEKAGLRLGLASTGRVNIHATAPGVVDILVGRIHALNAIHPMITVATVPPWQRVISGQMIATVKMISYAVPDTALEGACLAGEAAMRLCRIQRKTADLIQTSVDGLETGDKGHKVTAARLDRLGVSLGPKQVVAHQIEDLANALNASKAEALLILTGSATSDSLDVAPQALRYAGGVVTHFGMPVDPGNLLFYGTLDSRPVIGLPGCARAPALNGADWVLERLLADVPVTPSDIAAMGVGGLLKEIPARGRLRDA